MTLPRLPARELKLPVTSARMKAAEDLVLSSQDEALADLKWRLRNSRVAANRQETERRLALLAPADEARRLQALLAAHQAFQEYAPKNGAALGRIALLAGFPDPDPGSVRDQEGPAERTRVLATEEAKSWRERRRSVWASYDEVVNALDSAVREAAAADQRSIIEEMALALEEDQRQAEKLADRRNTQIGASGSALAGSSTESLRGVPAVAVTMPAVQVAPRPTISAKEAQSPDRTRVLSDLAIWAASHNYVLAPTKDAARDATKEFMLWRNRHIVGR